MICQKCVEFYSLKHDEFLVLSWSGGDRMVKLKVGRNILDIDENDMILDNGKCYQIITKK